jgi:hypothetical protein
VLKEAIPKLEKVGALVGGVDTNGVAALESAARKLELKLVAWQSLRSSTAWPPWAFL